MQRKKILWLVSWYPNRNDRFDGDFIQRHAKAAAIFHDVHVVFVTDADMEKEIDEEWNYVTGLTEQIIYFKKKQGIAARLRKQIAWKDLYQEAVRKYVDKNSLPDCVHVHVPWKAGLIALWMKKKFGTNFIVSEHWGMYNANASESFYSKPKLTQKLLKEIYNNANAVVTVSNFLANDIRKFAERDVDVIIPNVVDTTLFLSKEEKYSKFTFVHVSNMVKLKNVNTILAAFKKAIDTLGNAVQLVMIGNRNNEYLTVAEQLGILNTSVFFKGEISYREVAEEMKRSHCLVLFSDSETFSCVTAEALSCGVPVISSAVGALPELVHITNGVLLPINDKDALAIAMIEMVEKYPSYNQRKISGDAIKKFSYSAVSQKFDELYREFC